MDFFFLHLKQFTQFVGNSGISSSRAFFPLLPALNSIIISLLSLTFLNYLACTYAKWNGSHAIFNVWIGHDVEKSMPLETNQCGRKTTRLYCIAKWKKCDENMQMHEYYCAGSLLGLNEVRCGRVECEYLISIPRKWRLTLSGHFALWFANAFA